MLGTSLTKRDDPLGCCTIFHDGSLLWFLALILPLPKCEGGVFFLPFVSPLITVQLPILTHPLRQQPEC